MKTYSYNSILIGIILFFLAPINLDAQRLENECATVSTGTDHLLNIPASQWRNLSGTRVMRLYIVVYADDDGSNVAMPELDIISEVKSTDSILNIGDICFNIVGIERRNSTAFNRPNSSSTDFSGQIVANCFTVFIVFSINGASGSSGTFGYAPDIPASYMVTKQAGFGPRRTFVHELGHALGLHHTFKGTGNDSDNPGCDELVNGSNGTTCGDFVADTGADPYERCGTSSLGGCTFPYTGTGCRDANNAVYNPPMTNIMSYWANYNCNRQIFTAGQYQRMRNTIDNNSTLSSFLVSDNLVYTNQTTNSGFIRAGAKFTIQAGNVSSSGNYTVGGSVQATYSANSITLLPGFTANPTSGLVHFLASFCY